MTRKKVAVGMSGGVDSSVAAHLLKQQGYHVIAVFMKNWEDIDDITGECVSAEDYRDIVSVCGKLSIPFYTLNFVQRYRQEVFEKLLIGLKRGITPNPDVLCNREIKFGAFFDYCINKLGVDCVATGHYAQIVGDSLYKAVDKNKDQTYFLNQIEGSILNKVLFPLGQLTKRQVRETARQLQLDNREKKESMGICFVGKKDFGDFVAQYLGVHKGDIVDVGGKTVGQHNGLFRYTIGQRKGLGIGGVRGGAMGNWFVVGKNIGSNSLIVRQGNGQELYSNACTIAGFSAIDGQALPQRCNAKFRHRQDDQGVQVARNNDIVDIVFDEPQRAITLGQYAVLYDGDRCIGGGEIVAVR